MRAAWAGARCAGRRAGGAGAAATAHEQAQAQREQQEARLRQIETALETARATAAGAEAAAPQARSRPPAHCRAGAARRSRPSFLPTGAGPPARIGRERSSAAALREARSALRAMEAAWLAGQAGRLAASLRAGDPCPVCGSLEHHRPCRWRPGSRMRRSRPHTRGWSRREGEAAQCRAGSRPSCWRPRRAWPSWSVRWARRVTPAPKRRAAGAAGRGAGASWPVRVPRPRRPARWRAGRHAARRGRGGAPGGGGHGAAPVSRSTGAAAGRMACRQRARAGSIARAGGRGTGPCRRRGLTCRGRGRAAGRAGRRARSHQRLAAAGAAHGAAWAGGGAPGGPGGTGARGFRAGPGAAGLAVTRRPWRRRAGRRPPWKDWRRRCASST